jgi:nuclease S1
MRRVGAIVVLWNLFASSDAMAWGAEGHRLIAKLAEQQLSPAARAGVERLLRQDPGATMESVSTWADEVRHPGSGPLHYVNLLDGDCSYRRERDCPDGRCVVEAIVAKTSVLRSQAPDAERLAALKWVIHLVADIHQPLHVGLKQDKGGNLFQVRAFGRGSNLHAVWDSGLIWRRGEDLHRLVAGQSEQDTRTLHLREPAQWAKESCQISNSEGFYPGRHMVDTEYAVQWDATLVNQLAAAAHRLSATLNEVFGERRPGADYFQSEK